MTGEIIPLEPYKLEKDATYGVLVRASLPQESYARIHLQLDKASAQHGPGLEFVTRPAPCEYCEANAGHNFCSHCGRKL